MEPERLVPVAVALLGVVAASAGVAATKSPVVEVGVVVAGVVTFGAGVVWYRRRREHADEVLFDERIEQLAYRSGELAFRVSLALAMLLFLGVEAERVPVTARESFVVLILSMVAARFGLYGWYRRQSV
jgi:drug/metabolite transporter (DMT)-like permease